MPRPKKTDEETLRTARSLAAAGYSPAQIATHLGLKAANPFVTAVHLNALARALQTGYGPRPAWYEYAVAENLKYTADLAMAKRQREAAKADTRE